MGQKLQRESGKMIHGRSCKKTIIHVSCTTLYDFAIILHLSHNFQNKQIVRICFLPVADFCSGPSMTAYGLQILGQTLQDSQQQNTDPKLRNKK